MLSLGSNLGNRADLLKQARTMIQQEIGEIVRQSSIYENNSCGFESAPFLNQLIEIDTTMTPTQLLEKTEAIERRLGREIESKRNFQDDEYQDRTMDIDILLYKKEEIHTSRLTIPHAKIEEREFILLLLTELYENEIIPPFYLSFKQLLQKINLSKKVAI